MCKEGKLTVDSAKVENFRGITLGLGAAKALLVMWGCGLRHGGGGSGQKMGRQ